MLGFGVGIEKHCHFLVTKNSQINPLRAGMTDDSFAYFSSEENKTISKHLKKIWKNKNSNLNSTTNANSMKSLSDCQSGEHQPEPNLSLLLVHT